MGKKKGGGKKGGKGKRARRCPPPWPPACPYSHPPILRSSAHRHGHRRPAPRRPRRRCGPRPPPAAAPARVRIQRPRARAWLVAPRRRRRRDLGPPGRLGGRLHDADAQQCNVHVALRRRCFGTARPYLQNSDGATASCSPPQTTTTASPPSSRRAPVRNRERARRERGADGGEAGTTSRRCYYARAVSLAASSPPQLQQPRRWAAAAARLPELIGEIAVEGDVERVGPTVTSPSPYPHSHLDHPSPSPSASASPRPRPRPHPGDRVARVRRRHERDGRRSAPRRRCCSSRASGHEPLTDALLERGADTYATNPEGSTPMMSPRTAATVYVPLLSASRLRAGSNLTQRNPSPGPTPERLLLRQPPRRRAVPLAAQRRHST